ncbi:hypothetical protein CRI77_03520 [Mycolicibacterium duvalii]|uniref:Uncharacterized protein n=1 Tax=Mycolicibacterium duvalii TaxID=39688 RepID=A0A7I7KA67_9MYCO|nr:DUF1365 family protein [Mycolicibacterium duvalii]MCV7366556.1 DUF1365 family protein [Mycolicibacterium duvalii]PEG43670.1 hypothetical protein CRI77_03520 [Mycolicibacterium duvalii]BBX20388.1 hypothetical protein MDUV_52480 [Mycolicibacterium duvalii]
MRPDYRGGNRGSAALYRTRITHLRRAPVHHYFEHRSYSWFVDVDALPRLPRWLRPFAVFDARDHLWPAADDTLRGRVDAYLAGKGIDLGGGTVTALMHARVLGHVFNPLTLYWCHDVHGVLQCVIAEVHNLSGDRHAYLLPPADDHAVMVDKRFRASAFSGTDGHYLVRAPQPDDTLDVTISLHREHQPAFVATMRGTRRAAGIRQILALQVTAPLAPLMNVLSMRVQAALLWLRRVPLVPDRAGDRRVTTAASTPRHQLSTRRECPVGPIMARDRQETRSP